MSKVIIRSLSDIVVYEECRPLWSRLEITQDTYQLPISSRIWLELVLATENTHLKTAHKDVSFVRFGLRSRLSQELVTNRPVTPGSLLQRQD